MFDWLTVELLIYSGLSGLAFGAVVVLHYAWRDREYLAHRWRGGSAASAPETYYFVDQHRNSGYTPNPVTQDERDGLLWSVAIWTSVGALLPALIFEAPAFAVIWGMALLHAGTALFIVIAHPRRLRSEPPLEEGDPPPTRWQRAKHDVFGAAAFGGMAIVIGPVLDWLEAKGLDQIALIGGFIVAGSAILWVWISQLREPVDEQTSWSERTRVRRDRFLGSYAGPVTILVLFGLIASLSLS